MSKTLSDYQTKLDQVLQDLDEELEPDPKAAFLQEAINTHSQHRPQILIVSVTGTGTFLYDLPAGWEEGFSSIESIEYPVGEQNPILLDQTKYMIYQGIDGSQLRFLYDSPGATETFLLSYTARHVVATGAEIPPIATTIPDNDFDAVCNLAGALCCYALGRKLTEESGGASMAVRDQTWRSVLRYSEKGKELMALYYSHIGVHQNAPAASVSGTWKGNPTWGTGWTFFRRRG